MNKTFYIRGIDALRGLSIGMVLLNHLGVDTFFENSDYFKNHIWQLFSGETGVRIFFVISGFLITYTILLEQRQAGSFNLKRFFWRRFFRLFPSLFILCMSVAFLMLLGIVKSDFLAVFYALTYLYNYVPLIHYSNELAHTWSLGVEEQFYLIWSVILLFVKRFNFLILICLLFCVLGILIQSFTPDFLTHFEFRPKRFLVSMSGYIFIGCLMYFVVDRFQFLVAQIQAIYVCSFVVLSYISPLIVPTQLLAVALFFQATGVAVLIGWIYLNQKSVLVQLLNWQPFIYIGKISYSLYIVQGFFLTTGPGSELVFQRFPFNIILTVTIAIILYFSVELPIRSWSRRKY